MTLRPGHVLAIVLFVCASAVTGASWWRSRGGRGVESFASYLPKDVHTLVRIDLDALRMGGYLDALAGEATEQDNDYRRFVEQTGFDFRQNLDGVLLGISPNATYVFATGEFKWKSLKDYAVASGGICRSAFCRMQSGSPGRWVSFFPVRNGTLALASSADAWAASSLIERRADLKNPIPANSAVWIRAPGLQVAESSLIPQALRPLAAIWRPAEEVEFSVGGDTAVEIRFLARCANRELAEEITNQLKEATRLLTGAAGSPGSDGASLVDALRSGQFETRDREARGHWRIPASTRLNPAR